MPLKSGKSQKTVSSNISELTSSLKEKGIDPKKAQKMAVAAALKKKRESKKS